MRRWTLFALLVPLSLGACNQNVINTPIRSFDRPSDVALTCVQGNPTAQRIYDAHPLSDCTPENVTKLTFDTTGKTNPDGGFIPQQRALVTQSARGELSLVDVTANQLVDLRPFTPGFGFLPVGKMPTHVRVAEDGCRAATANTDSCDLSLIDLPTLYNEPRVPLISDGGIPDGSPLGQASFGDDVVREIPIQVKGRLLLARPSWIELAPTPPKPASGPLPQSYAGVHGYEPGGTAGQCVGGSYHAWVALPTCQMVVEVNLAGGVDAAGQPEPPGEVVSAIRVTRSGAEVVSDLSTISCPEECQPPPAPLGDGGVADGGVAATPDGGSSLTPSFDGGDVTDGGVPRVPDNQAYPGTLALDFENGVGRLFIGDLAGERVTIVPIDQASGKLGAPRAVTLEKGALGVQVVRVSPRSAAGKFLYAVARDGTVRVVDLDREVECETNPDPRAVEALPLAKDSSQVKAGQAPLPLPNPLPQARILGCFPLGDPATPPRSPLFTSPGITLPNGALPRDVSFVHLDVLPVVDPAAPPVNAAPATMVGDFAWIVGSDGRATVVNLFDACPEPNLPQSINNNMQGPYTPECALDNVGLSRVNASGVSLASVLPGNPVPLENDRIAHRIRQSNDRFRALAAGDTTGAPRVDDVNNPFSITVNGVAAQVPNTLAVDGGAPDLAVPADMGASDLGAAELPGLVVQVNSYGSKQAIAFYDPDHVRTETWSVAWEGLIPVTQRSLGQMQAPGTDPQTPPMLVDPGAAFCTHGVQAGDKLVLRGCAQDTDCDFQQICVRDPGAPIDVPNGMCVVRDEPGRDAAKKLCSPLLRSLRTFRITSAKQGVAVSGSGVTDRLTLEEIYEQPDPIDPADCSVPGAPPCAPVLSAAKGADGQPIELPTTCSPMPDGSHQCVRLCITADDAQHANDKDPVHQMCGTDYVCATSLMNDDRCTQGPLNANLFTTCMGELQAYEVHGGNAYIVSGSASGFLTDLEPDPVTRECVVPPESSPFTRLHQPRIPIALSALQDCPAGNDVLAAMSGVPAVCLFSNDQQARVIHFENPYFAIGLTLPQDQLVPPLNTVLSFNVIGGGAPLSVPLTIDSAAQQPMVVVTAPDRATVYVVDEGKSTVATGLRGQLFRLFSSTQAVDRAFVIR